MPRGSHHQETGWLGVDDAGQLVLRRDGGGRWRLEAGFLFTWQARRKLLGKRVMLSGTRDGFDVLAVEAIKPI